jgi:hypothetical protein
MADIVYQNGNGRSHSIACDDRVLSAERLSQAIQNIPDYSQLDTSGFVQDVWKSFKGDVANIFRSAVNRRPGNGVTSSRRIDGPRI